MKNHVVLFPCDFSPMACESLRELINWQGAVIQKLIIYHVASRNESKGLIKHKSPEELYTHLLEKNPDISKVPHSFEWEYGVSVDRISTRVHDINIDWLVMASKGVKGIDLLWGSRSEQILKETTMPAILVPDGASLNPIHKIALASDFQNEISENQIIPLLDILEHSNAELDILSINAEHSSLNLQQRIHKRHLKNRLRHFSPTFNTRMHNGSVSSGLKEYCLENGIDMLCIPSRMSSLLTRLFKDSVTQSLLQEARLPILIVK